MPETKKLCLTMIVKNESKIIERLFDSVIRLIDCYSICDTGSTDNTIEIIKNYFEKKGIPGQLIEEPFQNFEYNRTFAIHKAMDMKIADFLLLLDADMKIKINPNLNIQKLLCSGADIFSIYQGSDNFSYHNTRIIKCDKEIRYIGVTHEYVSFPSKMKTTLIPKELIFIEDIGDGGSKSDKFERDIRLLSKKVEEDENDARSWFYLANSYYDTGKHSDALRAYQKRVDIGGWAQEVFYSHYRMGMIYTQLKNEPLMIFQFLKAYESCPERLEPIHKLVNYYREKGKHALAKGFYIMAESHKPRNNKDDFLFREDAVYNFLMDYEYTIIAYYLGDKTFSKPFLNVFNNSNDMNIILNVLRNLKFYNLSKPFELANVKPFIFTKKGMLGWKNYVFQNCTTSSLSMILLSSDTLLVNMRWVNYYITNSGNYEFENNLIVTWNEPVLIHKYDTEKSWTDNNKSFIPQYANTETISIENEKDIKETRINGIEDLRLYRSIVDHNIYYLGVMCFGEGDIGIVHGKYDYEQKIVSFPTRLKHATSEKIEKNWTFVPYQGKDCLIYKWNPLQIFELKEPFDNLEKVVEHSMPNIFNLARGSTNGVLDPDGKTIWFIIHLVSYESPRVYYHMILTLDSQTLKLKKYSAPFRFNTNSPIQYCIGLCATETEFIIGYSEWDRSSNVLVLPRKDVEKMLVFS